MSGSGVRTQRTIHSYETEYGESTSASTETCDDWTYEYEGEKYEI